MILLPSESQEAASLMQWAALHPICKKYLIHIPNEGLRSVVTGYRLKREGLKKGVSDYFLAYPSNDKGGLWIELKRRQKSRLTPFQSNFIIDMKDVGYGAFVAYGWEDAKNIIENYLNN